jgi:hypothetical protein
MTNDETKSGSNAGVVILVVLLVLALPCVAGLGLVFLGGAFFVGHVQPAPAPMQAFPGPLPAAMPVEGANTVQSMQWSQNLFDQAEGVLTAAKYQQIQPGMTYEEVLAVLEIPENRRPPDMELIGPDSDVELEWVGGTDDDLSITVRMKGKMVVGKEQTGFNLK